ncbi:MAG: hypothetical protein DBX47_02025 [Clostridiales bacterium]|nr:MAG: hypothetical protein DBX47_02025 [Clostridiales bacterium]
MKRILAFMLTVLFLSSLSIYICANSVIEDNVKPVDFGSFSGNSDYGGSSGGSSGGSDYGSSDTYYSGGGSGSFTFGDVFWGIFVIGVVLVIVFLSAKRKANMNNSVNSGAQPTSPTLLKPVSEYLSIDPKFSSEEFCQKLSNIYVQLQNGWQHKDISEVRVFLSDELYNQANRQLESMRQNNQTNHVDNIAVLSVDISGFMQNDKNDVLVARLKTRIVDYTTDDNTGNVISGSNTAEKFMEYEWTLIRTKGHITAESDSDFKKTNCPSCGAPMEVNYSAKCEYCGSVLNNGDYDWVISSIKGISQQTA